MTCGVRKIRAALFSSCTAGVRRQGGQEARVAMVAEHIACPRCGTVLEKPAQLFVLGAAMESNGSFVALGDPDRIMPCPACGAGLVVSDILSGKHDVGARGNAHTGQGGCAEAAGGLLGIALVLGLIAFLATRC
jgi:hypothetical protein